MKRIIALTLALTCVANAQDPTLANSEDIANLQGQLDNKVSTSLLSSTGGGSKVLQFDAGGNLFLGPLSTDASHSSLDFAKGNLILTDARMVAWYLSDGATPHYVAGAGHELARIRYDNSHSGGGEWNFDASNRVCFYWNGGFQFGNANGGTHYIYLHSGSASAGVTERQSVPFMLTSATWTGGTNAYNRIALQAAPLDLTGSNTGLHIYQSAPVDSTVQDLGATAAQRIATIAPAGIWSAGTAPSFNTLTDGATITQTCSKYKTVQTAAVTLAGNRTIVVSGAENGMRGILYVSQDATGSRTLTPTNGTALGLSTAANSVDRVQWEFDGTYFYWSVQKAAAKTLAVLDADAAAFLAATSISASSTEGIALNTLVTRLKADNVWSEIVSAWPLIGGTSAAHAVDLKGVRTATFGAGVTHDANGITGNAGSTGWMNSTVNVSALGLKDSIGIYCYNRTADITASGRIMGTTGTNGRLYLTRTTTNMYAHGPCSGTLNTASRSVGTDCRGHFLWQRTSSIYGLFRFNGSSVTPTDSSVAAPTAPIWFLAANDSTNTAANPTNANLAFCAVVTGNLDSTKATAMFAAIDAFQTALGRANP